MKRLLLLTVIACLTFAGWSRAQQQELADHPAELQLQKMANASCPPSSNPSGGQ